MRITLEKSGPNVFQQAAAKRRQAARAKQRAAEPAVENPHPSLQEFRKVFPEKYAQRYFRGGWLMSAARDEYRKIKAGTVKRHIAF